MFLISERFRLEVKWDKAIYERDGVCKLEGAKLCGPALKEADRLNPNDYIDLDFFSQYYVLVSNVYVGRLSWGDVAYNKDGSVILKNAVITHDTELNKVPKFKINDYLVIDTSDHTTEQHPNNLYYKTYVTNEDTELYNFRSK
ncbi:MAG: hypothetical protein DRP42_01460 [Tenericutes bacterium]|nr:MAG: hypothetical protein DRP42_01460 [Mycoplasmatota bacterium]